MSTPEGGEVVADRYRLASLIGRGGNGTVWRAQDTLLGRAVAVKRIQIPPQLGEAEGARVRRKVLHEARACARLTQPGAMQEILNKYINDIFDGKQDATPAIMKQMTTEIQQILDQPRL